jgi:hypothetical protein
MLRRIKSMLRRSDTHKFMGIWQADAIRADPQAAAQYCARAASPSAIFAPVRRSDALNRIV